jgi:hypothetical protein
MTNKLATIDPTKLDAVTGGAQQPQQPQQLPIPLPTPILPHIPQPIIDLGVRVGRSVYRWFTGR